MTELLTAKQWQRRKRVAILDPDGWRHEGMSLDDRIGEDEFERRLLESTIKHEPRVETR